MRWSKYIWRNPRHSRPQYLCIGEKRQFHLHLSVDDQPGSAKIHAGCSDVRVKVTWNRQIGVQSVAEDLQPLLLNGAAFVAEKAQQPTPEITPM